MHHGLAELFAGFRLRNCVEEFTPVDTSPWDGVEVDAFLNYEYGLTRAAITAGAEVSRVKETVRWVGQDLRLHTGAEVLDLGCGVGLHSHRLADHGYRTTGIDISERFIAFARTRARAAGLPCTYRHMSVFNVDFAQEFDFVLSVQGPSLQLTPTQLAGFAGRTSAALRAGGHLLCQFSVLPLRSTAEPIEVKVSKCPDGSRLLDRSVHAMMLRKLAFPESRQRVNHRIFLCGDGEFIEWWSRFVLHERDELVQTLERAGFEVRELFGAQIGQPLSDEETTCHVWATRSDRRRMPR